VRPLRRTLLALALATLAVSLPACTHDNPEVASSTPGSTASGGGPVTSNEEVHFKPGEYGYSFAGITAALKLTGSSGTLEVTNDSGADMGAPSLYAITGGDERFDASVDQAAPVANGQTASFKVTFPDKVNEQSIGLIVFLLGDENLGAMAPVPLGTASPSG